MRALNLTNSYRNARLGSTRRMAYPIARLAEPRAHLGTVDLRRAIEVCEHAGRNDPIARAFLARKGQCVVGHRPAATFLTADTAWNEAAGDYFRAWCDACDVTGTTDFCGLARATVEGWGTDGGPLLVFVRTANGPRLQFVPGNRLQNPGNGADTDRLASGVEIDAAGRAARYHVARWEHAGRSLSTATDHVDAADAVLVANPHLRVPGQHRGTPRLLSVVDRLEAIAQYQEAVDVAARMAAMFCLFITREDPTGTLRSEMNSALTGANAETAAEAAVADARDEIAATPGTITELGLGEGIQSTNPAQPTQAYADKITTDLRIVCADLGVPLPMVLYLFESNFSGNRAGISAAWREVEAEQGYLTHKMLNPVLRFVIGSAVRRGELPVPPGGPADLSNAEWRLPQMPTLDLQHAVTAVKDAVAAGLMTREAALAYLDGPQLRPFLKARGAEIRAEAEAGVVTGEPLQQTVSTTDDGNASPAERDGPDGTGDQHA